MTEDEYTAALARIAELMDRTPEIGPGDPQCDELLRLVGRVEAYEALHFPYGDLRN